MTNIFSNLSPHSEFKYSFRGRSILYVVVAGVSEGFSGFVGSVDICIIFFRNPVGNLSIYEWSYHCCATEQFAPDELRGLRFADNGEAFRVLRTKAWGAGFDLASRQSTLLEYGEFRCTKGGRVRGRKTAKCDCPFVIKTSMSPMGEVYIRMDASLCVEHNHDLDPGQYVHKLLPSEVEELASEMWRSGVKPVQIMKFMQARGIMVSTLQVQWMVRKQRIVEFENQTEHLAALMKESPGSLVEPFEATVDKQKHRWGMLTFTADELENLERYGDVLFIDGTYSNLRLKWEIIPITGITTDGNLCCCGVFYAAMTNETILGWLLSKLWQLKRNDVVKWRTVITDEDAAFLAAFRELNLWGLRNGYDIGLSHVLCAFHKERNFESALVKSGLTKGERATAKDLFRIICYCPHRGYVDHCVQELNAMNERLKKYLDKEINPLLGNFSRAYLRHVHALGYNTTSPSESMNRLLKHGLAGRPTLAESRQHFNIVLADHGRTSRAKVLRRRHPVLEKGWVPAEIYRFIGRKTAEGIMKEIEKAKEVDIDIKEGQWEGMFNPQEVSFEDVVKLVFVAREPGRNGHAYDLTTSGCECGLLTFRGIPCCHLLSLHKKLGWEFPRQLIHARWCLREPRQMDTEPWGEDRSNEETHQTPASETIEGTVQQRYNMLFGLAKQLASRASRNRELAERYCQGLRAMLAEMIALPPETFGGISGPEEDEAQPTIIDVVDIVGQPKGRPKGKRLGRE